MASVPTLMGADSLESLMRRICEGDGAAFEELYNRLYPALWGFAYQQVRSPDLAEDIVHDMFTNLWIKRTEVRITSTVQGYLYKGVRNAAGYHKRHAAVVRKNLPFVQEVAVDWASIRETDPLRTIVNTETNAELQLAIDRLTEITRTALYLRWVRGLDYRSIGEVLGMSADAVRMQVSRALTQLRRFLDGP